MKKKISCMVLIFLLLPFTSIGREKKYRFGEIRIQDGALIVNFEVYELFSEEVLQGLQKGMTAALEYQIQLWKQRPHWVDQLVTEEFVRMKVSYDNWEKRYVLTTPQEGPRLMNEDRIRHRCSQLVDFPMTSVDMLSDESPYSIAVKVILRPMSVENYQEIKRWLAGEVKELNPKAIRTSKSPGKKAGNWLLGLVLNLTGFGDRIITAKSPPFRWHEGSGIIRSEE
jgi:hypothetical protein